MVGEKRREKNEERLSSKTGTWYHLELVSCGPGRYLLGTSMDGTSQPSHLGKSLSVVLRWTNSHSFWTPKSPPSAPSLGNKCLIRFFLLECPNSPRGPSELPYMGQAPGGHVRCQVIPYHLFLSPFSLDKAVMVVSTLFTSFLKGSSTSLWNVKVLETSYHGFQKWAYHRLNFPLLIKIYKLY